MEAARRLGEYGAAAKRAVLPLERLLQKADTDIVASAIAGLQGIGEAGTTGLAQALQDERSKIREGAARALTEMNCDRSRILPDLVEALGDESEKVRELALSVLKSCADEKALPVLTGALRDDRVAVRRGAVRLLSEIEGTVTAAVPTLTEALADEDREIRQRAIAVLKRCGPDALGAVRGLIEILADGGEDEELQRDAALALGAIGGEAAIPALKAAWEDGDPGKRVRLASFTALRQLGEPPTLEELLEPEMVAIPEGKFWMGSPETERDRNNREGPQHEVEVGPFLLGKYPVTQAEWREVATLLPQVNRELEPDPSHFKGDDLPVERVSWLDAVEFCDRLTQDTGRDYRLPTEAEWEYACRAGTTTAYHFGEEITPKLANYYNDNKGETTPVGSYGVPNDFGLHDMHGNVWEWCQDDWHSSYNEAPTDGTAWMSDENHQPKVIRGGSWNNFPRYCRSASRNGPTRGNRYDILGFRVACGGPRT